MTYDPLIALLIFFLGFALLFLLFKPGTGWYWIINKNTELQEKTVKEDILKQLYHFENSGKRVSIASLSGALKLKDKTIVEAVEDMTDSGLLEQDGEILKLTEEGRRYSLKIVRVHRLYEKYLAEKTGYDKEEWHDRAETMEHLLNAKETDRLSLELGYPLYDPHGDPIPSETGKISPVQGINLSKLPVNFIGRITHIEDEPEVIYKQILAENIHHGSQIRVLETNQKRVVFYAEGEEYVLAPVVAANITVAPIESELEIDRDAYRLNNLKENEKAEILGISKESRGESRRRLLDLGFVKGATIEVDLPGPLQNPRAYLIKGTSIALRDDQASKILIKKI